MPAYFVLFLGLLLVFLEFYLPGAVMGTAGAVLIIASIVTYATSGASAVEILVFVLVAIFGLAAVVKGALWSIKRTGKNKSIFLNSDQEGFRASRYEEELIGRSGKCHTLLHPGGYVIVDKKKYAAISASGFLDKGDKVEVIGVEGETLKVRKA